MKVAILIVNWNTGNLLRNCLQSIDNLPEDEKALISRIVVVDNASQDDSFELANVAFGDRREFSLIKSSKNLGFAGGNRLALDSLDVGERAESHVLLLNPDTEIESGGVMAMLNVLRNNESVGVVGCRLINSDGSQQESVRSFPTFIVLVWLMLKLNKVITNARFWKKYMMRGFDYEKEQVVDQVMGAAMLIRKEVLTKVGFLDPEYFVWFEEVDLCRRAKLEGWEIVYTPNGEVRHYGGVSFNQLVGFKKVKPWLDSLLTYANKNLSKLEYVGLMCLWPLAISIGVVIGIVKR